MRPPSIIWFERLYGLAILVGIGGALLLVAQINALPNVKLVGGYAGVVIGTAISLLLLWLVARRASDPARWVLVVLTVLSLAAMAVSLVRGTYGLDAVHAFEIVNRVLTVAALAMTFRDDAQDWLVTPRDEEEFEA